MAALNWVSFNQDHSQLVAATTRGLRIYSTDPFELVSQSLDEDVSIAEQLFSTSLVATVVTPRLLRIVNTKRSSTICELSFHGMIVAVKMNRKRLIVALEDTVFAYDISNMRMLHSQLTPMNPTGICAISPSSENNYLVLPHYQKSAPGSQAQASHVPKAVSKENISGDVLIYDLNKMEEMTVVTAHQTAVSCLALSNDGRLLATASEKGTVIRIFSIPDGKKLYQFRRGSMPSRILSMSFNAASTLLCVSSATETVHIFRLAPPGQTVKPKASSAAASSPPPPRQGSVSPSTSDDPSDSIMPDEEEENSSKTVRSSNFMSMVRRTSQNVSNTLVSRAAGYLPSSVTEIWEPQRDFAWVRVPRGPSGASQKSVVAMGNQSPSIMVATNEGDFFVYSIDLEHGGEGTLVRQYHDIHGLRNAKGRDMDI